MQHERGPRNALLLLQKENNLNEKFLKSPTVESEIYRSLDAFLETLLLQKPSIKIHHNEAINDPETFNEIVARLLFKSVGWMGNLAKYFGICLSDQVNSITKLLPYLFVKKCIFMFQLITFTFTHAGSTTRAVMEQFIFT